MGKGERVDHRRVTRSHVLGRVAIMTIRNFIKKYQNEFIVVGVLLVAYIPAMLWMWDRWFAKDSYYSHGIFIPFVSGYLIWAKRDILRKIPLKSSPWGMVLIVSGILVYLLSSLFRVYFSSAFSMLVVLVGLILHFYGIRMFRAIIFPVGFLFFMMPLPLVVIVNISFQLKIFAAEIAHKVLVSMGFNAFREGSIIRMPHAHVVVDDVCSGLRSLISLTALASIFAYWLKAPMYKRIFLFLAAIPVAVITNVCRVVFLSSVSEIWGTQYATGFVHDLSGFMVFALAFGILYVLVKLLE